MRAVQTLPELSNSQVELELYFPWCYKCPTQPTSQQSSTLWGTSEVVCGLNPSITRQRCIKTWTTHFT